MTQEIRVPDIGDAEDVEVVEILASAGDQVGDDDPIIVIESDKASMEVPAGAAGVIASIEVAVGDKVSEGQVIARLEGSSAETKPDSEVAQEMPAKAPPAKDAASRAATKAGDGEAAKARPPAAAQKQIEVRVPDIGEAENVEVIEVAVKAGDQVAADDLLVVVESDKASMEIPSTHAGSIREVHVSVGSQVEEGTLLVTLEADADSVGAADSESVGAVSRPRSAAADSDSVDSESVGAVSRPRSAGSDRGSETAPTGGAEVYAGPAVRRLARELGVDLTAVRGTGNRGRIVKDDVKAHVKTRLSSPAAAPTGLPAMPKVDFAKFGEVEEQPLSRIRARGAQNLHRAWLNVPHVTQHDDFDVTDLEDFRASLKSEGERRGVKVTPLAFIIKACCHLLKEFPTFNASLDPTATKFILKRYYNVGMAVDTPDGLVVPVIHGADRKGVWELSAEVVELAQKARDGKLGVGDMQGGSFSVSSLGAIGGTGFTPIINAPEVAILGVSRVSVRPQWRGEAFLPRKMLPVSLSYDHRAINGAEAGRFVTRLGELLGDIRRLAL